MLNTVQESIKEGIYYLEGLLIKKEVQDSFVFGG